MNLAMLRELVDLAYTLNFSETASRLYISQPTLSKHISAIENELGVQLFIRTKQHVRITEAGTRFCEKMRRMVALYDEAAYELRNTLEHMEGTLRVGFLDAAVRSILSPCLQQFRAQYPNINLVLQSGELGDIDRAVKRDELDLCLTILFSNSTLPPEWHFEPLYDDGLAAVIPLDNPLSGRDRVRFSELMDYPLGLPDPHQYPDYARLLMEMEAASGRKAQVVCEFSHVDTAAILSESGSAITVLPAHLCLYPHYAHFIPLDEPSAVLRIGALWRVANHTPGLLQLVDLLCAAVQEVEMPPR